MGLVLACFGELADLRRRAPARSAGAFDDRAGGVRRLALNLAKANQAKGSIRGKLKRAGWDNAFRAALMLQMR